jgi:hypothetical protein
VNKKLRATLIASVLAGLWATGASAAPITVNYTGFADGSAQGGIAGVRTATVQAGEFSFNVTENGGVFWDSVLEAFCIDVTTNLVQANGVQYDLVAASSLGATRLSLIGNLYDNYAATLSGSVQSAAFQLALWEIIYDYGGALNLNAGSFKATSSFDGARALASTWLSGLSASYVSSNYDFYVLEAISPAKNQRLLTAQLRPVQVPEPATLAILGTGLLLCGVMRRRRYS